MAYMDLPAEGAIGFGWARSIGSIHNMILVEMLSGEIFLVDRNVHVPTDTWIAYRFHKSTAICIPGVVDLPYHITWCRELDELAYNGLNANIVRLNQASQNMSTWRKQLGEAEWRCLQAGSQATVAGTISALSIGSTLACIASGGLFLVPLGIAAATGMACASSVGEMEKAAYQGNALVNKINAEYRSLYRIGADLQLPELAVHSTPVIRSACTQVSDTFDWLRGTVWWNQKGIGNYLSSELKFQAA